MGRQSADAVLRQLERLAGLAADAEPTDRQLLERFAEGGDETAFTALVHRHGALVQGVCRRVLHHAQDAEDAFQAAFLVLAREAKRIRWQESAGNWLYCVAYRLAVDARRAAARRRRLAEQVALSRPPEPPPGNDLADICAVVDEEVFRLPESCRIPVLRCYLEGQTRDEAARQLGWSLRTLERRLEKARELLRKRLTVRGLTMTAALLAVELERTAWGAVPATGLLERTVRAARHFIHADFAPGGPVSPDAAVLAAGTLRALAVAKVKRTAALLMTACVFLAGAGLLAQHAGFWRAEEPGGPQAPVAAAGQAPNAKERPRVDALGDPLPRGALARMGTTRFRFKNFGDPGPVFAPDGKVLATGSVDGTIRVFEADTGRTICQLRHRASSLAFAPDGKSLASGGKNKILLWDVPGGTVIRALTTPASCRALCYTRDGTILAAAADTTIELWDVATGQKLRTLSGARGSVRSLSFSPDGNVLASAHWWNRSGDGADNSVRLWDVATGKELRRLTGHGQGVCSVAYAPDGKVLASAGYDLTVRVWDPDTGKEIRNLTGARGKNVTNAYTQACFSPDGKTLASWGEAYPGRVRLWETATGKEIRTWTGHYNSFHGVAFAPDGKTLASTGDDNILRRWDAASGGEIRNWTGHQGSVLSLTFGPNGKFLLSGSADRTVRLWRTADGKEIHTWTCEVYSSAALAPDGTTVAAGDRNTLRLWSAATGKELFHRTHPNVLLSVAFAPDGKTLASGCADGVIRLWDVASGTELRKLTKADPDRIFLPFSVAFVPGGKYLAAGAGLSLWDVATGKEVLSRKGGWLTFAPDGRSYVPASQRCDLENPDEREPANTLRIRETATGKEVRSISGLSGRVSVAAYSPDGKVLATAVSGDTSVHLWDLATGRAIGSFAGHLGGIASLAFGPDGKTLASASDDTTVLLWDVFGLATQRTPGTPTHQDLQALWDQLEISDVPRAYRALGGLLRCPAQSLPFLRGRVKPVAAPTARHLDQLVTDLDSERFAVRQRAMEELEELGELAQPALARVLEGKPLLERRRRIEGVLSKVGTLSGQRLRLWRAIQVLEAIGTPDAQALLKAVADGEPASRLTREAGASLERLAK